ncbi:MAG: hypothetical protein HRT89_24120 [Lentisphaeria bacterium]|nr:hypothetical protein [Lentisphaeria bacterium]
MSAKKALEIDATNFEAQKVAGIASFNLKKVDDAINYFQTANQLKADIPVKYLLSRLQPKQQEKFLLEILSIDSKYKAAIKDIIEYYEKTGQSNKADKYKKID